MRRLLIAVCAVLLLGSTAMAQFGPSGTTTLSVNVRPEAGIRVDVGTTTLATTGSSFANDYVGTTSFTYKIRTSRVGGTGSVQLQVTSDFNPGGPSVASPPSPGDALAYTCTVTAPGTACTGRQTASTTAATPVASFGADARSSRNGNTGSVSWALTNDPLYSTGSYTATVTLTISAT